MTGLRFQIVQALVMFEIFTLSIDWFFLIFLLYIFSILTNPDIMRHLQSLSAHMQMMTGMNLPVSVIFLFINHIFYEMNGLYSPDES